jgi:hypothetical protein
VVVFNWGDPNPIDHKLREIDHHLGEFKGLGAPDPLFTFLTVRQTLSFAMVLEVTALLCIVRYGTSAPALEVTACLSTIFLVYRSGLWLFGWNGLCTCLGRLTEPLGLSPHTTNIALLGALAYLFLGSWWCLIYDRISTCLPDRKSDEQNAKNDFTNL